MKFKSIMFLKEEDRTRCEKAVEPPDFFTDLNLDQVIDAITAGREQYDLKPLFNIPLGDIDTIVYRQEIAQDFEDKSLLESIKSFAQEMTTVRRYLTMIEKLDDKYHRQGWYLEAAIVYGVALKRLSQYLLQTLLNSRGLKHFRKYLTSYVGSDGFAGLLGEAEKLKTDLAAIQYCIIALPGKVKVRQCEQEIDYSVEVERTFAKFKQGAVKSYLSKLSAAAGMNHIEAAILDRVAQLYPDLFLRLDQYNEKYKDFVDENIAVFNREIQFYIAFREHVARFESAGLRFCYPRITTAKEIYDDQGFDLALARKLLAERSQIVCNDFYLKDEERILIISGPNQGGKTTFARTFGQLHYLAALGCPVPGRQAQLFLFDALFTHFEREENIHNLRGKLQDDLVRMHRILDRASPRSIIIMNEIFTSTTVKDALFLSRKVMQKILRLDVLCAWVTFVDELASVSPKTISMVSTVVPDNPALRTFKIVRKPADGLAYAMAVAAKYRLTYERLKERIQP
jgi:DNA mismatch repair protein MutS